MEFAKHVQHGQELIQEIANGLGEPDAHQKALRILRAVLHAVRDSLSFEESLDLLAQLPLLIKGIYVEGWSSHRAKERVRTLEAFAEKVIERGGPKFTDIVPTVSHAINVSQIVIDVLRRRVSEGEIEDIRARLPKPLKLLFEEDVVPHARPRTPTIPRPAPSM